MVHILTIDNDNMQGLVLFTHINRLGSLSAAAQMLGMSRSSVSKQLTALEKRIGSRLFNRTTRKIALTEVGRQVLEEAHKVELALQAIAHISEDSQSEISGSLKISCASAQGRIHLVPLLTQFLAQHPNIDVNLQLEDRFVDMVAENIDVSIRVGYLPDSTLVARKIGDLSGILCASPTYLQSAPPLETPGDLLNHRCLFYRNSNTAMNQWSLSNGKEEEHITVTGPLTINDPGALVSAAVDHAGVLITDRSLLGDSLREGELVQVMTDYHVNGGLPIYIVYREREFMPAKNRALVDFLLEKMPPKFERKH